MSQSYTYIDSWGLQAQYTVYELDSRNEYRWSTDHGDHGIAPSHAEAQGRARTALKTSMAIRNRPGTNNWH
jgi:hypothetical protein